MNKVNLESHIYVLTIILVKIDEYQMIYGRGCTYFTENRNLKNTLF